MTRAIAFWVLLGTILWAGAAAAQTPPDTPAARLSAMEALYPPWQHGHNNDAANRGLEFTVPPVDVLADFHGSLDDPALVLYASGNYFFAMAPLVKAFGEAHPQYRGRLYYETLPPGLLLKQLEAGGTVTSGNMTWTVKPDVFMAELRASENLVRSGKLTGEVVPFVTNDLTIMVPAGNPGQVKGLQDLGQSGVAVVMPNPAWEGVAQQIRDSLVKAGGEVLAMTVYEQKVKDGTTILTRIHHRQTPLFLMQGLGVAGVTWTSEALFQEQTGHPISHVSIPEEQNTRAVYSAALVAGAPHTEAARAWLDFLRSETALRIFERYGFKRYAAAAR